MNRILLIIMLPTSFCFSQWFNLDHEGINRTYYVSYPSGNSESSPLIINMHGFGGNPSNQLSGTQMNTYAFPQNIAVVYPQGMNNAWNVGTFWDTHSYNDIGFINLLIDDVASNFDIDLNRVYACGFSNGGYMTYELACELSDKIAAFGSVSGNFMLNSNQQCSDTRDIPIIHFHGTIDQVVGYYPPSFDQSLTVEESIHYWVGFNDLTIENYESLNSNVNIYTYSKETSSTEFVHYQVVGGNHEWFGNNWGFHASEELINFFLQYQLSDFIDSSILGDLNEDSDINIQDVILLINIILNSEYSELADLNGDLQIDILDIVQIINVILG